MPANTSGFGVSVLPGIAYANPDSLVAHPQNILGGVGQGLGLFNALQQISDAAQARPINREMAQISLDQARQHAALLPLIQARKATELAQPIESVEGVGINTVPRFGNLQPMTDENGAVILGPDGQPRMENVAGDDVFETQNIKSIDPLTGAVSRESRNLKPLTTVEQQAREQDMAEYRDQLATIRQQQADTARIAAEAKAENDQLKAQAAMHRVEAAVNDPKWRNTGVLEDANGNGVVTQVNAAGEVRQIPTGLKKTHSFFNFGGINLAPGAQPSATNAATGAAVALDPALQAILDNVPAAQPKIAVPVTYADPAAVKAALVSGKIKRAEAEQILREKFGFK